MVHGIRLRISQTTGQRQAARFTFTLTSTLIRGLERIGSLSLGSRRRDPVRVASTALRVASKPSLADLSAHHPRSRPLQVAHSALPRVPA